MKVYVFLFILTESIGSVLTYEETLNLQFLPKLNTIRNSTQLFPHILLLKVLWSSKSVVLNLEKAPNVNLNTPIEFSNEDIKLLSTKNVAFYQDVSKQSVVSMVGIRTSESSVSLKLHGSFVFEGETHEIRPEYLETPSAGLFSDEDLHGTHVPSQHLIHKRSLRTQEDTVFSVVVDDFLPLPPVHNISVMQNGEQFPSSMTTDNSRINSRVKRAVPVMTESLVIPSYHIDMEFILDFSVWQYWLDFANGSSVEAASHLRYFYLHVIAGIDMAYRTIQPEDGYQIACFLSRILILQTAEELGVIPANSSETIEVLPAINRLRLWNIDQNSVVEDPDHTMLFTRKGLLSDGSPIIGIAYTSGVCRATSVSITQQNGMQRTWMTAAHELGHNLGSFHDGPGTNCTDDQFLMTPSFQSVLTPTELDNSFTFSTCTKEAIRDLLDGTTDGYPRVCLASRVCNHTLPITNQEVELIRNNTFTVEDQCRFITDFENSTLCNPDQDRSELCASLTCSLPGNACQQINPGLAQYSECGENKFCLSGACVDRSSEVPFPPILGESSCVRTNISAEPPSACAQSTTAFFTLDNVPVTCDEGLQVVPQVCFTHDVIQSICCESCSRLGLVDQTQHIVTIPPLDGMWSEWSPYAGCSVSCGNGTQQRTRTCTNPAPRFGGEGCVGSPTEMQDCSTPVSCNEIGMWSIWSSLSPCKCTTRMRYRTRSCTDGRHCVGLPYEVESCDST